MSITDIVIYVLMIGITAIAQFQVKSNYKKFKAVNNTRKITGQEVARKVLDKNGLSDVHIVEVEGELTDHYDPSRKVVRLSSDIFHGESIASASVAAHECGHAIQDKVNYMPMRIRSLLVTPVNIASSISVYIILAGIILDIFKLSIVGVCLFATSLLFHLVTLPVEFNASSRAKKELIELKLLTDNENKGVSKMLYAAALTYVAGVLTSALQVLRYAVWAFAGSSRRRR